MSKLKKKILIIADHPQIPSGVGHMNSLICNHLVKSGYDVICFGGAVKHPTYEIQNVNGIKIYPVDVYGTPDQLRSVMQIEDPDMIFLFTDPRYFEWVWMMEDEIRDKIPIFYYHVWDCDPVPKYNTSWYESCDFISCISKLTYRIVKNFNVPCNYVPHGINTNVFKPIDDSFLIRDRKSRIIKKSYYYDDDTFIVFWNNRNIRRKIPGHVMEIFSEFNKMVENSIMIMHTNVVDNEGTDLYAIKEDLYKDAKIIFTDFKIDQKELNLFYNMADVTVNFAYNEGFGLSTIESMAAGTPIIVNMTGGLQDQIEYKKDGKIYKTGIGIKPHTRTLVGSVPTPYIYDDRVDTKDAVKALKKMYDMSKEERIEMSKRARENAVENFNEEKMVTEVEKSIRKTFEIFKCRDPWTITRFEG